MRRHTEETRRKLSENKMGPRNPNYRRFGLLNPLFGKRNPKLAGKNNCKWRGGITDLNNRIRTCAYYSLWREKEFARDRYKCARCGDDRGGNLEAHHIRPFYKIMEKNCISDYEAAMACKELWDVDNGIAICEKCHIEISAGAAW
jgi:5-methylcytosine-specific restriction endonuclease McrA